MEPVLIDGQWRAARAGGSFRAFNPATKGPLPPEYPVSAWDDCDAALAAASGEADTYLAATFTLPLEEWSPVLTQQVCAIAAWHLLVTVGFNPSGDHDRAVRERCEDARRWLAQVATQKGELAATGTAALGPAIVGMRLRGWRTR